MAWHALEAHSDLKGAMWAMARYRTLSRCMWSNKMARTDVCHVSSVCRSIWSPWSSQSQPGVQQNTAQLCIWNGMLCLCSWLHTVFTWAYMKKLFKKMAKNNCASGFLLVLSPNRYEFVLLSCKPCGLLSTDTIVQLPWSSWWYRSRWNT